MRAPPPAETTTPHHETSAPLPRGQLDEFIVEQPLVAGACIVVHAPAEQATKASQEASGSSPYSQVTTPVHVSPEVGMEDRHTMLAFASSAAPSLLP